MNKTFVQMPEVLGYDIQRTYVKHEANKNIYKPMLYSLEAGGEKQEVKRE